MGDWYVGQRVAIVGTRLNRGATPSGPHTIEKIGKREMRLSNGERWLISVSPARVGSRGDWSLSSWTLRPWTDEHAAQQERGRVLAWFHGHRNFDRYSTLALKRARRILAEDTGMMSRASGEGDG